MQWALFDFGEVISLPQPKEAGDLLVAAAGAAPEDFWAAYWAGRVDYDLGRVDAAGYWGEVCGRLGRVAGTDLLERLIALDLNSWMYTNRETLKILQLLAARGVSLALLSNAPLEIARLIDRQPWAAAFEHRFFSCDLGLVKPDPLIFKHVCAQLGAHPDDVLFVDDRSENIEAAELLGIRSIRFQDAGRLLSALEPMLPGGVR